MYKINSKRKAPRQATPLDRLSPRQLIGRELSTAVIAFHEAIAAQLGMNAAEWKSLGVLEQHGPLTAGRLAELSGFTTGAITGIVDRLERAGHVRRQRHPSDRRSVIIHPLRLREVKARVAPIFGSLAKRMAEISAAYAPAQLAAIYKFFGETTEALRSETAKLKAQAAGHARKATGGTNRSRPRAAKS
jgi:DNA-binding MarR family transcriptional regulator